MEKDDLGGSLMKMFEGTEMDRQLDEHFDNMLAKGFTEDEIMR